MHPLRARLVAARPGAQAYRASIDAIPTDLTRLDGRISDVFVYPVKGFGGVRVARARFAAAGLTDAVTGLADRGVMLAARKAGETAEGAPFDAITVSNRTEATFALTRGHIDGGALVYDAPGLPQLRLDRADLRPREGEVTRVRLYDGGPVIEGVRIESPLAEWTADLLRAHPRRRRFEPGDVIALAPRLGGRRELPSKHRAGQDAETYFGDGGHVLVASRATLDWMNVTLSSAGARPIDMEVFRPNLVVDGWPRNAEDLVGEIVVEGAEGDVSLLFASMCTRCDATRVDIHTGEKPDREPLAFLARERPPRGDDANSSTFAMNGVARPSALGRDFAPGDRVRVVSERD